MTFWLKSGCGYRRTTAPGDRPTEILLAAIYLNIALFLWFLFSPKKKDK